MICENLNFDVEIEGILFILMDMWMVYVKEVIEIFEENFGDCVFVLCIKKIVCFVEVFVKGMLVFKYDLDGMVV